MGLAILLGGVAVGCTTPVTPGDAGVDAFVAVIDAGADAALLPPDAAFPPDVDADVDASAPTDAGEPSDVGVGIDASAVVDAATSGDAGVTGPLSVSGGLGSRGGAISVSGGLVIVDDGFEGSGMTCNGALCAYGGFR